jgi:hypothetical protein
MMRVISEGTIQKEETRQIALRERFLRDEVWGEMIIKIGSTHWGAG